jgi:predicted peptidase
MKKVLFLFLILTASLKLYSQADTSRQTAAKFEKEVTFEVSLNYLVYLPQGYENDDKKWPVLLFLHGAGERGNDLNYLKRLGPPMLIEQGIDFPFIVISPQCPLGQRWEPLELTALLDEVENIYRVDTTKVYLTGLSMGGEGVWRLIFTQPDRFAAIAPVCGRSSSYYLDACRIKDLPVWVFHGARDDVVSISESERIVNALKNCGSDVRFTIYPEGNHNAWTETYNNGELYKWFLEHHLENTEKNDTN